MNPEPKPDIRNFVLFCSDADFSRAVMHHFARRGFLPRLVVLPEFAPAPASADMSTALLEPRAERNFPPEYDRIEFAYAPASQQADFGARLQRRGFDFFLVACWPYLLSQAMLGAARHAALNLHPSLLPAYRGADPIGAQLERGDFDFGITLHELDSDFDRGDIIDQRVLPSFRGRPTRAELEQSCADLGVEMFVQAVQSYPDWRRRAQPR